QTTQNSNRSNGRYPSKAALCSSCPLRPSWFRPFRVFALSRFRGLKQSVIQRWRIQPVYGFAGYCEVQRPGIPVEEAAVLLRRWGYVEFELMRLLGRKLTSLPEMEVKYALGRHLWEDSLHAQDLQTRIEQLRSKGSVTEARPDVDLAIILEETLHAPDTAAFLEVVYR